MWPMPHFSGALLLVVRGSQLKVGEGGENNQNSKRYLN